jgi:predicted transcriptional regulator
VSPRIKELIEHRLVKFDNKKYYLTPMGKTLVKSFLSFYNTLNVFDQNWDWWEEHDVSSIPDEMLFRIGELKNYFIIEDDNDNLNRTLKEMHNLVLNSKSLVGVSCAFDDSFPDVILKVAKNNKPVSIVITKDVYNIIKDNYITLIDEFFKTGNSIYLLNEDIKVSHIVTDTCLFFSLSYKNGKLDLHSNLLSNDKSSIKWGMDLYEYYKNKAELINLS